jgi:hypothetical protein
MLILAAILLAYLCVLVVMLSLCAAAKMGDRAMAAELSRSHEDERLRRPPVHRGASRRAANRMRHPRRLAG